MVVRRRAIRRECHNMHKIGEDANRFNTGLICDQSLSGSDQG
jgi:hypothetical protein